MRLWELDRFDWPSLRAAPGRSARGVPNAIRALVVAQDSATAESLYWEIDGTIAAQGQLYEASLPATGALMIALSSATKPGRLEVLNCLAQVANGAPAAEESAAGRDALELECLERIARGLSTILCVLETTTDDDEVDDCLVILARLSRVLGDVDIAQCRWYVKRWVEEHPDSPLSPVARDCLEALQ